MSYPEDEFLTRLRTTFRIEADEHVRHMSDCLIELEKTPEKDRASHIESIFRAAHSLKGAARAVNFPRIESTCQLLEHVFSAWKRGEIDLAVESFDVLHKVIDVIAKLSRAEEGQPSEAEEFEVAEITRQLSELTSPETNQNRETVEPPRTDFEEPAVVPSDPQPADFPSPTRERTVMPDTVRISTDKLDRLLLKAEEMLTLKQATSQRVADVRECEALIDQWGRQWAKSQTQIRQVWKLSDPEQVTHTPSAALTDTVRELLDRSFDPIRLLEQKVRSLGKSAAHDERTVNTMLGELVAHAKELVLLPFSTVTDGFPRLVRDLSRDQGKEAELVVRGGDIEVDKRILEEIKDALVHIVRNCIDHGIEKPEVRSALQKSPKATIAIAVSRLNGSKVEIAVSDDGAGIDLQKVKESAIKHRVLSPDDAAKLGEQELRALVFTSEISTSPILTEISGRGLGLAIVQERTEKLGGHVSVESTYGAGTTFRIVLPLTLATFRGVIVRVGDQLFVFPSAQVDRVIRMPLAEVKTVENFETIQLRNRTVSLAHLKRVLDLKGTPKPAQPQTLLTAVVADSADDQIAFVVDEVLQEEEVLVQSLPSPLVRVRGVSGATILGSGKILPILNVADLIKSAKRVSASPLEEITEVEVDTPRRRILVAEDSITSRMLLKSILESAGHEVTTAVDGVEALTELRANEFDLVVSDIEMPRMNGFDLIVQIRSDRRLADLPVVLVTALSSREDRERGIDVGANAYIVKSSFDQSDLLDAIRRLI